jgi:hypothetical protein
VALNPAGIIPKSNPASKQGNIISNGAKNEGERDKASKTEGKRGRDFEETSRRG